MTDEKKLELNEEEIVSDPAQVAAEMMASGKVPDNPADIAQAMGLEMGDKTTDVTPPGDGQVGRLIEQEEAAKSAKTDDTDDAKTAEEKTAAETLAAEQKAAEEKTDADKADAAKAKKEPSAPKDEDQFVETVDGKGRIPYSTLKETREKVTALREKTETLEQKLEEATAARNVLTRRLDESGADTSADQLGGKLPEGVELLSDEDITALREEFPEAIVNSLEKINATNKTLVERLDGIQTASADKEAGRQDAIRDEVQSTIDANPVLSQWQKDKDPLWSAAIALDDALVESGKWRGRPLAERYNEVCKQLGHEIPAPAGEDKGDKGDKGDKPDEDLEKKKDISLTEKVDKKLKEAEDKAVPLSHSDLPAGEAPAQSEQEMTASMTTMQLEKKFEGMSTAQISEYLSRVA